MKILQELIDVITKYKVRHIDVIGNPDKDADKSQTKITQLYEALQAKEVENDQMAAELLELKTKSTGYRNVKNGLKKRLINTVFFIDVKQASYNEQQTAYYNCWRNWAAAKILIGKSARMTAVELSQKVLKQAIKYEFLELAIDVLKFLRMHYGNIVGDRKKFAEYNDLYNTYEKAWRAESKVEEYYCLLAIEYIHSKATKKELYEKAMDFAEELEDYLQQFPYYRIQLTARMIMIAGYMSINNYNRALTICEEGIHFFENKVYKAKVAMQILLHQQLICYIQLREYEKGLQVADKSLTLLTEGTHNWFKHYELQFMLAMHTRRYQEGYGILNKVVGHRKQKSRNDRALEKWKINQAYIHYLVLMEKIKPDEDDNRFNNFRLGKFLNEVPSYSQDKRGLNVPILVIHILFLILKKEYDKAIDRIEAIERYCSRYLQKDDTFRSNCFIKMLLQIPISGFHRSGVVRRAEKYRKQLDEVPLEVASQPYEIEVIPYEDLWEFALDSLENQFYQPKKGGKRSTRHKP